MRGAMSRARLRIVVVLLNAALSIAMQAVTPPVPERSDRAKYEYAGTHPLAPSCPQTDVLYCYRVLVPALLEQIPADPDLRWRVYRWTATTAAGIVVSMTTASLTGSAQAAIIASVLTQGSYGFAFTAYDPYSADPATFLMIAILAWCWLHDRWLIAAALGIIGIFAKETIAVMSAATALAAIVPPRRRTWPAWVVQAAIVFIVLVVYRWVMQTYFDWAINPGSASFLQNDLDKGGWLILWLHGNPPATQAFLIFASFAFAWLYAILGFREAPAEWRHLVLGAALPFLALNYVQNPERALGNLFFVVIPLASITLARVPVALAFAAALFSALLSARSGSSSDWLPSTKLVIIPGGLAALAVLWLRRSEWRNWSRQSDLNR